MSNGETMPDPMDYPRTLPKWARIGDHLAEFIVFVLLIGGFLTRGYIVHYSIQSIAWFLCALLGMWGLVGLPLGRWSHPGMRSARWAMVLMAIPILAFGVQLIPLPSDFVVSVSPVWNATLENMKASGLDLPERIPLAHSPARGWFSWNQLIAAYCFFSGVVLLAHRRSFCIRLMVAVCAVSVLEGLLGLLNVVMGSAGRAYGAVYNPNHHATLIAMAFPLFISGMFQWSRSSPLFRASLAGGSNPMLMMVALGALVIVGWLASFSRGSLIFGGGVTLGWVIYELWGMRRELFEHEGEKLPLHRIVIGAVLGVVVLGSLAAFFHSADLGEGIEARGWNTVEWFKDNRLEMSRATLEGLAESPWIGLGPAGTEQAITRFERAATVKASIWSHNDWVQIFSELGLPVGLTAVLVLGILLRSWAIGVGRSRRAFEWNDRMLHRAVTAGVLIVLLHALTDFHLRIPLVGFTFLILLALALTPGPLFITSMTVKKR